MVPYIESAKRKTIVPHKKRKVSLAMLIEFLKTILIFSVVVLKFIDSILYTLFYGLNWSLIFCVPVSLAQERNQGR